MPERNCSDGLQSRPFFYPSVPALLYARIVFCNYPHGHFNVEEADLGSATAYCPSTILHADGIGVFEKGKIVETGYPAGLFEQQGLLSAMLCPDRRALRSRDALVHGSINGPANHRWRDPARRSDARLGFFSTAGIPRCGGGMLTGTCPGTPQRWHSSRDASLSGGSPGPGWSRGGGGTGIDLREILSRV